MSTTSVSLLSRIVVTSLVISFLEVGMSSEILAFKGEHSKDLPTHFRHLRSSQPRSSLNGLETALKGRPRYLRSASTSEAISHGANITLSNFDFVNTVNADHVIAKTLGGNSTETTFILMVSYGFNTGWASVKESVLWWTDDHGENFQKRNFTDNTKISFMFTFPSDPYKMVLADTEHKMIYTTEDALVHNTSFTVPVEPDHLLPHPTNASKLLIYSYAEQKLYASENFGASWTFVAEYVKTPIYWGDPELDQSEDIVHLQIEGQNPSQASYKACRLPGCQPVSGELDRVGSFIAGSLMVEKDYMFVRKENHNKSESFLMVSYKRERFRRAQFPSTAKTSDFLILNVDDYQVFVAVHHGSTANLYLSDRTGQYYVLSLENVFYSVNMDWFEIDFAEIKGMNWTFIANKIVKSDSSKPTFVQTHVSYDKGGNWAPLFINKTCSEVETCSLLLELKENFGMGPIKSVDTAPGIILAHGILGKGHQKQFTSVLVTNDGGATWKQIPFNATSLLRVLNHGGLLTAIPDEVNSKMIHYSVDQGKTWESQKFDEGGLSIIDWSAVEEKDGAIILSIFGRQSMGTNWKFIKMNMTSLLPKKCEAEDYETWSPKDYNAGDSTQNCILGRVVQYRRRKADSFCYIDEPSTLHVVNNSTCLCTNEDYECDFGYEKAGDACHKASWSDDSFVPVECDNGGEFWKSQGYRKIPADVCIENEADKKKYDKKKADCPSAAPKGLSLMTATKIIPLGKEITVSLEQARGSKWDTNYTWNFGDRSDIESHTGFIDASEKEHTFQLSGTFKITVTAENKKGLAKAFFTVEVQDILTKLNIFTPWASVVGRDVKIDALPRSKVHMFPRGHIHYLWSFGDEAPKSLPLLSWNSSMTHVYDKAGTFTIKIEASNSLSTVFEEFSLRIFESALIMELQLEYSSPYFTSKHSLLDSLLAQSLRAQLAQDLGLDRDRLAAVALDIRSKAYLYLFPTERPNEISVTEIKEKIINLTNEGLLAFDLFGSYQISKDLIKIVSAKEISDSGPPPPTGPPPAAEDKKSDPNLTPIYIAVPVLAVLLIGIATLVVVIFRRRRRGGGTSQYALFESHDESDTMLDDEDVAPLNMNLEIAGGPTLDDSLIDSGRNCLVMETGRGTSGNEEIC